MRKQTKKKFSFKKFFVLVIFLYLVFVIGFNIVNTKIKTINVYGLKNLNESTVINASKIKTDSSLFFLNTKKVKKNISKNPFVKSIVIKKDHRGVINIHLEENKILFIEASKKMMVLEGGEKIPPNNSYLSTPELLNYVPDKIYEKFIKKFGSIESDIIRKIDSIEYSPHKKEGIVLDPERFILAMGDGNTIHINIINMEKLNKYNNIYEMLQESGTLFLDSSSKNYVFEGYIDEEEL